MKAVNGKILVRVDLEQKDFMMVGGFKLSTALKFEKNYREKSPVIAEVVDGNQFIKKGEVLICHHNHFYAPSPYHLYDDLYSIPFNKTILCKINNKGKVTPVCGNILGSRIEIPSQLEIPIEHRKTYTDRMLVTDNGWTLYKKGQVILTKPSSPYDIVYNFNGIENRITKVSEDMVVGILVDK